MNSHHTSSMLTHRTTAPAAPPTRSRRGFFAALAALALAATAHAQSYMPADITVPAGDTFTAHGLNDLGQVAGTYNVNGEAAPAVWHKGTLTLLPLVAGAPSGFAHGLNNIGQIVGSCAVPQTDGAIRASACVWENGTPRLLPPVPGATYTSAWAINDSGTIVGVAFTPVGTSHRREAVVWIGGTGVKITAPVAGAETWARAIDSAGRVAVSWTENVISWRAARWVPFSPNTASGAMTTLSTGQGFAYDINNSGIVCGDDAFLPATWDGTARTDLPLLPGHIASTARGLNDAGTLVGNSSLDEYTSTAWVVAPGDDAQDLNMLLIESSPLAYPGSLYDALAVNQSGQILAAAIDGYTLLTPSSQPPGPINPPAPSYVSSSAGDRTVQIVWSAAFDATSYNLKRATQSGGPFTTIATGLTGTLHTDTAVANGTRYFYVVSSVEGDYESANSPETSAKPLAPPVAPTSLAASVPKNGKGGVRLTWRQSTSSDLTANRIYRSVNGGTYQLLAQINAGTTYTDAAVTRRVSYAYRVTALNVNGHEGSASNAATVRP